MRREYPDLLKQIESAFADGVPRQEPIRWVPSTWLRQFPAGSLAARYLNELDGQPLDRTTVLDVAGRIPALSEVGRAFEVERLFLLSQVWGYGTVGYGAHRTATIMKRTQFISAVGRVHEVLMDSGAVAAYEAMRRGGPYNLSGLGPAFATKFIYFAGYGMVPPGSPEPLVLDRLVGAALHIGEPSVFGPRTGRGWNSGSYSSYLDAAEWVCANASLGRLTPADVEFMLFCIGRGR